MSWSLKNQRNQASGGLSFGAGIAFELALLFVATGWGWLFKRSPLAYVHWNMLEFFIGAVAVLPPFAFFLWTLRTNLKLLARHREVMYSLIDRVFCSWSILELALISACAGFCEEALFRGAIQATLAQRLGPIPALALASLLFGASHLLTWIYAILAGFIGMYLGWLYLCTDNLLVPITAHFLYDFVALIWLVRVRRRPRSP